MNGKVLKIASLVATGIGLLASFAVTVLNEKQQEEKINEAVNKAMTEMITEKES